MQEQQEGKERSYEEMVSIIKDAAEKARARQGASTFDPAVWMRDQIINADTRRGVAENRLATVVGVGATPYAKLIMAWEIISVPYITLLYHVAKSNAEAGIRARAKVLGDTITLDPKESMLLDAMAEAVGIHNPFGQQTGERKG
jgi:hypothetical protein